MSLSAEINTKEVDYYVYLYLKPDGTPFYVGKGREDRWKFHLAEAQKKTTKDKNKLKINTIKKIVKQGKEPIVKFVDINISEEQAFELECFLINEIGRVDLGTGTLTNLTNGGEGTSGHKHTEESKQKIGESVKGVPKPESQKQALSELLLSGNHPIFSDAARAKNRGGNHWAYGLVGSEHPSFGRKDTPEMIEAKRVRMLGRKMGVCTEERRENIRKATTGVKKSNTEKMKKPKRKSPCPRCGMLVDGGNMKRWHGDNCKSKKEIDNVVIN